MRREERKNESILTGTHEHLEDLRYFFPYPSWNIKSTNDVVHEIQAPASRYKNPLGWKKQMRVLFGKWLCLPNRIFGKTYACYDFPSPFPLRWKKVFDYIYKAGITQYPYPSFDKMYHDEPKVFGIRLWAKNGETDGSRIKGGYSRGVSFDMEEALSKVVGELLERYPLTIYRNKDLISASISDLRQKKTHFFDPFLLDQFSPWQKEKFPRYRFDDASRFCWVEGISLMTKKKALIPAQMVYWNYQILSNEPILRQMSTSGNGGMFTLTEALLSGLYELIQRDAFMLFWLNRIAPPRIEVTSIKNPEIVSLLESCKNYGLRVSFLDATSDFHIPVVITVLEDEYGGGPSVVLGGGCGLDPEHALIRSLIEAISVRYWLRDRMDKGQSCILPDGMEPFTTTTLNSITRMSYWGSPGMGEKIQFFLQGELRSINQSFLGAPEKNMMPEKQLKHLKKIFQKKGERYEIFYYEAKHEVLDTLGYSSVSVSVPAILPLFMDESRAPLGNPRLQEACRALGYKPAKTINPLPHPFP
ncbi:YcaO-like family protein [Candidatus Woesebacteria bacterium]|nr:YcaO-like family protein [Candidatus Woesebacteria bacterium]